MKKIAIGVLAMLLTINVTVSYSADAGLVGPPTRSEMEETADRLLPPRMLSSQNVGLVECLAAIWQENDYMFDNLSYEQGEGEGDSFYAVTGIRVYPGASRVSNYSVSFSKSGGCDVSVRQVTYTAKSCKEIKEKSRMRFTLLPAGFGQETELSDSEDKNWVDPFTGMMYCARERSFITNVRPSEHSAPRVSVPNVGLLFDTNPNKYLTIDGRYPQ